MAFSFAVLCDLHLPYVKNTAQYAAFEWALKKINFKNPDFCIVAGDITAKGELETMEYFSKRISSLKMPVEIVLGNSDYRNKDNIDKINSYVVKKDFCVNGRKILSLNTPSGIIDNHDRESLLSCDDGSIVILHHSIEGLEDESREFLSQWALKHTAHIIHAHSHKNKSYFIGNTKVIGIRPLDPDKSIDNPPCVTFFEFNEKDAVMKEFIFEYSTDNIADFRENIGIACFDTETGINFALSHGIKNVELKEIKTGNQWLEDTIKQVEKFRNAGGKLVSVHMPNIVFDGEKLVFDEKCEAAIQLVESIKPEKVTLHPPRKISAEAMKNDVSFRNAVIREYCHFLQKIPFNTFVGIENIHMKQTETLGNRCFGYIPEEIKLLVSEVRKHLDRDNIGIVLDVGHARNNGALSSRYTLGAWYREVGELAVTYHLHQVGRSPDGKMKNHTAILNWSGGPAICYESFFWAWQTEQVNHTTAFLEMRLLKDYEISLIALEKYFSEKRRGSNLCKI